MSSFSSTPRVLAVHCSSSFKFLWLFRELFRVLVFPCSQMAFSSRLRRGLRPSSAAPSLSFMFPSCAFYLSVLACLKPFCPRTWRALPSLGSASFYASLAPEECGPFAHLFPHRTAGNRSRSLPVGSARLPISFLVNSSPFFF